jgi:hypothetical protein
MKKTDKELRLNSGICLENVVSQFLKQYMSFGNRVKHNDFSPKKYPNENSNIVDIFLENKALIECTNPKDTTFMQDSIMNEKIDYFIRKDKEHKFLWCLVVSFYVSSKAILQRIKDLGIHLIVLNVTATKTNFHKVKYALYKSKLYQLLKPKSASKPTKIKPDSIHIPLSNHIYHTINTLSSNNYTKEEYYLYQHETLVQNLQAQLFNIKNNLSNLQGLRKGYREK